MGKEPFKKKGICRKACNTQGSDDCRRTRDGDNGDFVFNGQLDKAKPGVRNAGSTRIRDKGDSVAMLQSGEDKFLLLRFISLKIAGERFLDIKMSKKEASVSCILCSNQIDFFQDAEGP